MTRLSRRLGVGLCASLSARPGAPEVADRWRLLQKPVRRGGETYRQHRDCLRNRAEEELATEVSTRAGRCRRADVSLHAAVIQDGCG